MSKKHSFFLKGFDIKETDLKYGLVIISNIDMTVEPDKKTNIFDILEKSDEIPVSFVDEKNDKCMITMLDYIHKDFPTTTNMSCFWCKHSFPYKPLGCPIKYVNNRIEKSYVSNITKDKYFMKENVTKKKLDRIIDEKNETIDVKHIEKEHYMTDGIFCSFNCIIAFVNDNSHNSFYNESKMLTYTMYMDVVGKDVKKIKPSPHWRLLKSFGGPFTIDEYRKSFNFFEYEECSFHMKTLSKIFKEK